MREKLARVMLVLVAVGLVSCSQGSTDGDEGNDVAGLGAQFVADGGAGASLTISAPTTLATGSTSGFSVTALDPLGAPLAWLRLFCESERGIAILEPSAGGTSFESTGTNGMMSGVIGCTTPGSFMMECRGPDGYGLKTRAQVKCVGDVPQGFEGWPGAAGGNMGGGLIVDLTPDDVTDGGISISSVLIADGLGEASETDPIDTVFTTDCNADGTHDDPETFTDTLVTLKVSNDTAERLIFGEATFVVYDGRPGLTITEAVTTEVAPGTVGSVTTFLASFDGGSKSYAGTGMALIDGTYVVDVVLTGETESGEAFTLTDSFTITLFGVNNCG